MYFSTERSRNTYVHVKFDGESIFDVYITFWEDFDTQKHKTHTKTHKYFEELEVITDQMAFRSYDLRLGESSDGLCRSGTIFSFFELVFIYFCVF